MSLAVAIYVRLRENRATGLSVGLPVGRLVGRSFVRSLGRMVVAANMLKIIGLVALLIPGRHRARLLIVRVHPDARTNGTLFFPFAEHRHDSHDARRNGPVVPTEGESSLVVESKWKFNIPNVSLRPGRSPLRPHFGFPLPLSPPPISSLFPPALLGPIITLSRFQ